MRKTSALVLLKQPVFPLFFIFILFSLFCCFSINAEQQNLPKAAETPLALGDHFFFLGNYDAAITEYKRFLFFQPDNVSVGEAYRNIGFAYRAQRMWPEAIAAMRTAFQYTTNEVEKSERQLELAVILIASGNYDLGVLELIKMRMRKPSAALYQRARFLEGIAYLYQFRLGEAHEALQVYTNDGRLRLLFEQARNAPRKSVKLAKLLSAILPGAGQVYAGNWQDGLNALILNGALGFVTVDAILDGHYIDAILWATYIFARYYQGNPYRAGKAVEEFNDRTARLAAENILQRLQEIVDER